MSPPTVAKFTQGIMKVYPEFDSIRKVIEKVADERGLLIFDMHDEMTRGGGKAGWVRLGLSKEGRPSDEGRLLYDGKLFLQRADKLPQ